jgi:CRP/FNR family transcriptional regulator, cyclic AMP receptor protein
MMIRPIPPMTHFRERLRELLQHEMCQTGAFIVRKHLNVYASGDHDEMVYFIEDGKITQRMLSYGGKQCLLAIYTTGELFGELCLVEDGERKETATAMEDTILKSIPCAHFLLRLRQTSLLEEFIRYLAMRIADQQQAIANFVTMDSEQRLGKTLLQLAKKFSQKDPCHLRIRQKISHEELSEMVGTTRPRISQFMRRFRELGLIEITKEHHLIIKEEPFRRYLVKGD